MARGGGGGGRELSYKKEKKKKRPWKKKKKHPVQNIPGDELKWRGLNKKQSDAERILFLITERKREEIS